MPEIEMLTMVTRPTPSAMYAALRAEWRISLGSEPTRASLLVLLAHWGLETANGAASRNYNVAGLKWTKGCGHNFTHYATVEIVNGVEVHGQKCFRAYNTLEEGVADYLYELRHDFLFAWPAVEAGDLTDFAHRLKERHYYTDYEAKYAAGLHARAAQLDAYIGPDTQPDVTPVPLPPEAVAQGTDPDGQPWVDDKPKDA